MWTDKELHEIYACACIQAREKDPSLSDEAVRALLAEDDECSWFEPAVDLFLEKKYKAIQEIVRGVV